jgi:Fic family protein
MELTEILQQIDSLKKEAEILQPVKPELQKVFWDKFRLEFNYNSNHMEGNTLTYGHTQLLLLFDRISGDYTGREIEEMKAHDVALKMIREVAADPENQLNEKLIREINELILVRPYYNKAITPDGQSTRRLITPGKYKKHPNSVMLQDGGMFYYASPEETPALMGDLVEWYNNEKGKIHPVELAARFHYKLVRIHPFDDSNGRTTRLMMNYILMQNGYAPIVIESKKKEMYLTALNKADVGDIDAFVDYIAGLSIRWQEIYLKALMGEKIEEEGDFEKEVEVLKKRISEKDKVTEVFSKEIVQSLVTNSFIPLYKKIILKLGKMDIFFHSKAIHFGFNELRFSILKTEQIEKLIQEQAEKIHTNGNINFSYIHKGLSTKENGVKDYFSQIIIWLSNYRYEIAFEENEKPFLVKKYSEPLTDLEVKQIIDTISKKELDFIKNNT